MNELLIILGIILVFSVEVLLEKIFKKEAMYVWIPVALIIANILTAKNIDIFGVSTTMGTLMFASVYLATDILNEKYGKKESIKALNIGIVLLILFTIITQVSLLFKPNAFDFINGSLKDVFSINLRITIASIVMCYLSNMLDIHLFEKIKSKTGNSKLWLRNNVATIVSNCLENYLFIFMAFVGIYDIKTILIIATTTSIIECVIALLDTPFLYLSKNLK